MRRTRVRFSEVFFRGPLYRLMFFTFLTVFCIALLPWAGFAFLNVPQVVGQVLGLLLFVELNLYMYFCASGPAWRTWVGFGILLGSFIFLSYAALLLR